MPYIVAFRNYYSLHLAWQSFTTWSTFETSSLKITCHPPCFCEVMVRKLHLLDFMRHPAGPPSCRNNYCIWEEECFPLVALYFLHILPSLSLTISSFFFFWHWNSLISTSEILCAIYFNLLLSFKLLFLKPHFHEAPSLDVEMSLPSSESPKEVFKHIFLGHLGLTEFKSLRLVHNRDIHQH